MGYDAGKKVNGRKRHIATDTLGLMLFVLVHAADVQDRDGAPALLQAIRHRFPWLRIRTPGSFVEQWQDEVSSKFVLPFDILMRNQVDAARTGTPFAERSLLIAHLDMVRPSRTTLELLRSDRRYGREEWYVPRQPAAPNYTLGRPTEGYLDFHANCASLTGETQPVTRSGAHPAIEDHLYTLDHLVSLRPPGSA